MPSLNTEDSRGIRSLNIEGSRRMHPLNTDGSRGMRSLNIEGSLGMRSLNTEGSRWYGWTSLLPTNHAKLCKILVPQTRLRTRDMLVVIKVFAAYGMVAAAQAPTSTAR